MIGGMQPDGAVCSRASCHEAAAWRIDWQNPRIHTGDRWKTWLACEEHVGYLRGFLETRSFPVRVEAFAGELDEAAEVDS